MGYLECHVLQVFWANNLFPDVVPPIAEFTETDNFLGIYITELNRLIHDSRNLSLYD